MYAVTIKNLPITIWFTTMTVVQCALGTYMTVLTAKNGGEARRLCQKNHPNSERRRAPSLFCLNSPTTAGDTTGFISPMRIFTA